MQKLISFLFASNRNALHQNKQVIFCACGMRIDTEVRIISSDGKSNVGKKGQKISLSLVSQMATIINNIIGQG